MVKLALAGMIAIAGANGPVRAADGGASGERVATYHIVGPIYRVHAAHLQEWMGRQRGVTRIDIEIDSPGGMMDAGLAMGATIVKSSVPVRCVVRGTAASAAFFVLQHCRERIATKGAQLMTHEPRQATSGTMTRQELAAAAAELTLMARVWNSILAVRMGLPLAEYESHVDKGQDWRMTPAEALKVGALDRIE